MPERIQPEQKPPLSSLLNLLKGIKNREESPSPALLDEILSQANYEVKEKNEYLRGYKFRNVEPPEQLLNEIKALNALIEETKLERMKPEIQDIHRNAKKFYENPLKPAVSEEPKNEN